jgi:hypothetical protein
MPLTGRAEGTLQRGQPVVEEIGLDPKIYPAAGPVEGAMRSEEEVADLTDRKRVCLAIAAHRAWRPAAAAAEEGSEAGEEEVVAEEVAADGVDSGR